MSEAPRLFDPTADYRPPIASPADPPSSLLAAERIEPERGTRKGRVLAVLDLAASGPGDGWVDGHELTAPGVGGSEGLRRLRELRQGGWKIERRPNPTSPTAWQYRLAAEQPQ